MEAIPQIQVTKQCRSHLLIGWKLICRFTIAFYEVGKVFERGQIELVSYIKSTRELAKELFLSKDTAIKRSVYTAKININN